MKFNRIIIVALLTAGCLSVSNAQNAFKVGYDLFGNTGNGSSDSYSGFGLVFEHKVAEKVSIGVTGLYNWKSLSSNGFDATGTILTIQPEVKYYFNQALNGFYLGAEAAYHSIGANVSSSGFSVNVSKGYFGLGALAGYQTNLSDRILLNIGGGYGIIFDSDSSTGASNTGKYNLDLQFGYRF